MIAISLFNGYGGLAVAMREAGVNLNKLYASEIDPYANTAATLLHPDTIQLGDILKWREWDIDWSNLNLVTAGSPCQGFSPAGKQGGTKCTLDGVEYIVADRETYIEMKEKGAIFESASYLFWEFVLFLDYARLRNPSIQFMLENVKMTPNNSNMITKAIGVEPVLINAELNTPQNRERMYWCSWKLHQPVQQHIVISDIVEEGEFKLRPCVLREKIGQGVCHHIADATDVGNNKSLKRVYAMSGKMPTLTTMQGGSREPKWIVSYNPPRYRLATLREMMRGQGMPEWVNDLLLASELSPTQLKKMLGNGWPLPVIVHNLQCYLGVQNEYSNQDIFYSDSNRTLTECNSTC